VSGSTPVWVRDGNYKQGAASYRIHDHDYAFVVTPVELDDLAESGTKTNDRHLTTLKPSIISRYRIAALFSLRSFYTRFRRTTIIPEIKPYFDLKGSMSVPPYPGPAPGEAAPAYRRSELKVACVQFDVKVDLRNFVELWLMESLEK
jgi:hypothetical protein